METTFNFIELEHALSFRYLAQQTSPNHHHRISWSGHKDEPVEFDFSPNPTSSTNDIVIFCGKIMKPPGFDFQKTTLQSTDYDQNSTIQSKVSSSLSSVSSKNKLHKVLIGLAKMPTKMELNDIKERQSRRPPLIPANVGDNGGRVKENWCETKWRRMRSRVRCVSQKASFGCFPFGRPSV